MLITKFFLISNNLLNCNILNILNCISILSTLNPKSELLASRHQLLKRYKQLLEEAYNLRQTDSAQSDISEFKALQLLDEINKLRFLNREPLEPIS